MSPNDVRMYTTRSFKFRPKYILSTTNTTNSQVLRMGKRMDRRVLRVKKRVLPVEKRVPRVEKSVLQVDKQVL